MVQCWAQIGQIWQTPEGSEGTLRLLHGLPAKSQEGIKAEKDPRAVEFGKSVYQ